MSARRLEAELVGSIIWTQITKETKAACRARRPVVGDNVLWFLVGAADRRATHRVMVELERCDTYTVSLRRVDRLTWEGKELTRVEGVCADSLNNVVNAMATGKGISHDAR